MKARLLLRAASTLVVAMLVGLAVPVSQLRVVDVIRECCCPDPNHCHCPDHKSDRSGQPSMRVCHGTQQVVTSPQAPSFVAPEVVAVASVPVIAEPIALAADQPHAAPAPRRPDAPS